MQEVVKGKHPSTSVKTPKGSILISGASIAGPCLAYWLNRAGFQTTVLERAPKFRDGGQNIDISGVARTVVSRMGLLAEVKAANTTEIGLRFVDSHGKTVGEFPKNGDDSFTSEYEIRRGDLSRIFYEASRNQTNYRFGMSIESLKEKADAVEVVFADGSKGNYDLVIAADGVGSSTRNLMMEKNSFRLKYLGIWMGYFRIPKVPTDDRWARWYNADRGRVILMRPSDEKSEAVTVGFRSEDPEVKHLSHEDQQSVIKNLLRGAGWESERIASALDYDDDIYMGPILQVKSNSWSKGRFAMVGDAAYGPSPITGMGTSLAVIGAYILAGELAVNASYRQAFEAYEKLLKPFVLKVQKLPPGVPRLVYPSTKAGVHALRLCAMVFGSRIVTIIRNILRPGKTGRKDADLFELPDYQF